MIKTFRKKPVKIEGVLWDGENIEECKEFLGDSFIGARTERHIGGRRYLTIETLHGEAIVEKGDYILKSVMGDFYPCEKNVLENTYEEV